MILERISYVLVVELNLDTDTTSWIPMVLSLIYRIINDFLIYALDTKFLG